MTIKAERRVRTRLSTTTMGNSEFVSNLSCDDGGGGPGVVVSKDAGLNTNEGVHGGIRACRKP